jgi:membrane associated rhomboid family serine protease
MDLTSSQRQHVSALWTRLSSSNGGKGEDNITSSKLAFLILGLLNLPVPAAYHLIKSRATRHAIAEWPKTFNARWVASFWPDKKPSLLADHISSRVRDALQDFAPMLVLSPLTSRKNRWWTLVTANFTHFKLSHLLGNMLALNAIGPACAEVPGMTPFHVFGIALTASLATGFQALYRLGDAPGWKMCGFSAVACAFTSVAALGAPMAQPDVFGKYPVKSQSVLTVAGMQILSDVLSVVRAQSGSEGSGPGKSEVVDYMGHLVGYACGAAYYTVFLWFQGSANDDDGEVDAVEHEVVEQKEVPDLPTVMEELRRTRQAAPVRQSEDWEEIASKLRHSAPEKET